MLKLRIREERLNRNWSQEQLAEKLNMTKTAVSCWERGVREPELETLSKLADIFNCTIDYLAGRTDDRDAKVYSGVRNGDTIKVHIHKSYPHDLTPNEVEKLLDNLVDSGFNVDKLIEKAKSNQ